MRFRRKSRPVPAPLDLTPCSDIIFTLLLFYILTQSFVTSLPIGLPGLSGPPRTISADVRKIEIPASGAIALDGERLTMAALETRLHHLAATSASDTPFLVLADKTSPAGISLEILDLLRSAGFSQATFAGTTPEIVKESPTGFSPAAVGTNE